MTLDDFQTRLRAIFDESTRQIVEANAAHDAALQSLFREVDSSTADLVAFRAICTAETVRYVQQTRLLLAPINASKAF